MKISRMHLIAHIPLVFSLAAAGAQAASGPSQCQKTYNTCLSQEASLNAEITQIKNEISVDQAALKTAQANLPAVTAQVNAFTNAVANDKATLAAAEQALAACGGAPNNSACEKKERAAVRAAENQLDSDPASLRAAQTALNQDNSAIQQLQSQILSLQGRLSGLQQQLAGRSCTACPPTVSPS